MVIQADQSLDDVFEAVSSQIRLATVEKQHPFRLVTLATQGNVQIGLRYVVLRKVTPTFSFYIYTDARAEKVKHLRINEEVHLLFYDPVAKLQVRVDGTAHVHQIDDLAKAEWQHVQGIGKRAYGSILAPGEVVDAPEEAHNWPSEIDDEYFAVIHIHPQKMEALQLNRLEHRRVQFIHSNESWKGQWLAP